MIQRGVEHVKRPVVPGATHTVYCSCGAAFDVVANGGAEAMNKILARHRHEGAAVTVKEIPA